MNSRFSHKTCSCSLPSLGSSTQPAGQDGNLDIIFDWCYPHHPSPSPWASPLSVPPVYLVPFLWGLFIAPAKTKSLRDSVWAGPSLLLCSPCCSPTGLLAVPRRFQTASCSTRNLSHSHQQPTGVPVSPHPHQQLILSAFLSRVIPVDVKWCLWFWFAFL